jgi:hypothetical protein
VCHHDGVFNSSACPHGAFEQSQSKNFMSVMGEKQEAAGSREINSDYF